MRFTAFLAEANFFKRVSTRFILVWAIAFSSVSAFAGIEPYSNSIRGSLKKGDTLVVKDEKFRSPFYNWNDIERQKTRNIISFRLFQDTAALIPNFSCDVKLKIEYFASADQPEPLKIQNVNLHINYNKDSIFSNKLLDTYSFENGYWVKLTIENINSKEFGNKVPPFIELVSQIIIDRTYKHDPNKKLNTIYNFTTTSVPQTLSNKQNLSSQSFMTMESVTGNTTSPNEMEITWSGSADAEYDIEWTTLDNNNPDYTIQIQKINNGTITTDELNELFRFKATRVTTHGNQYTVTLTHYNDYLFFRIRTVQYTVDGLRDEGAWDYSNGAGYAFFPVPEWHEENFNWQFTASYAEEGKKKEVISYFDGTLRSRQTVTISDNRDETGVSSGTDKNVVVQENIYDEFGRVVGSILPAPKEGSVFQYFPNLNTTQGGQVYTWKNIIASSGCESAPQPLSTNDGAGNYYSPANTFLADANLVQRNPFTKYIPDAEGYPLSVTLYTADNTGRIKVQGGVGKEFQPAAQNSRTTKYFYGKPEQDELDKLFGNDVGYAEHYLKNMVVDPNYQVSVSYIDASGKTIATALSGNTPENLVSLPAKPAVQQQTKDILTAAQFRYDLASLTLSATTTYLAAIPDNAASLSFNIDKLIYQYQKQGESWKICSNCYYDLSISIVDDCGTQVFNQTQLAIGSSLADCNSTGNHTATYTGINFSKIGEYQIKFEFALSKKIIEKYTEDYIQERQTRGDWKTELQFVLEHTNLEEFENCLSDCATCKEELGTKPEFIANAVAQFGNQLQGYSVSDLNTYFDALYNRLYAHCQAIQATCTISPCDRYKKLMLEDVSPGGQYALFKFSTDDIETTEVTPIEPELNIIFQHWREQFPVLSPDDDLYKNSIIEKSDGTRISPYDIAFTLTDLVVYWKDEWAEKFLTYHPEQCKLQFCEQNATYYNWDNRVTEEIMAVGDIATHPSTSGATYDYNNPAWLVSKDPFFATGAPGAALKNNMIADLEQYTTRKLALQPAYNKSLIQFIDYTLYCADPAGSTNSNTNADNWSNCTPVASCRIPDREWDMYKDVYFQLKEFYYEAVRAATTCNGVCEVGTPVTYSPGSCPTREDIVILPGSPLIENTSPQGYVPVVFKNTRGKANGTITVTLSYSSEFSSLGLPSAIVFTNGQSEIRTSISDQVPLSAIYIAAVSCSGATPLPADYCPFGNSGTLTITDITYQRPSQNSFIVTSGGIATSYTIENGRADQPPADNCANGGTIQSKTFYSCYRVSLPDQSFPLQYYDVWLTVCATDACQSAPQYYHQTVGSESGATVYEHNFSYNDCAYNQMRYYVYEGYNSSTQPEAPNASCGSAGQFFGFFDCVKFANNTTGVITTHTNVWIYYCENFVNECNGFQQQVQGNSAQKTNITTDAVIYPDSTNDFGVIMRQRLLGKLDRLPSSKIQVPAQIKTSSTSSMSSMETMTVYQGVVTPSSAVFGCDQGVNNSRLIAGNFNGDRELETQVEYTALLDLTAIPQGALVTVDVDAHYVGNIFTILDGNGSSLAAIPRGNPYTSTTTGTIQFTRGTGSHYTLWVQARIPPDGADLWEAYVSVNCSTVPQPSGCNPLLISKKSRFPSVTEPNLPTDINALVNEGLKEVKEQIQTSCEGQAEYWMDKLDECLKNLYPNETTYNAKKAELKQKLIEVCVAGGDIEHPNGASTTRPGTVSASGYNSFKQVILGVLGLSSPDMLCNPWLLEAYPWANPPQAVRQTITATSPELCNKLNQLKQQHIAANSGLSFYNYLKQTFGNANVTFTESDITTLTKGCDNCRYLLEKEVPLPVFLDPAGGGCITPSQWAVALNDFSNEFTGSALNPAHANYGDMLSNYLNQRWGFTLTYDQYQKYMADLVSQPQTLLCNKPVYEPIVLQPYQCINSLLSNALANGRKAYTAYLEQQKKIFRTNYVNTCLVLAKPAATLTIKEQTYHYTLYYYDQAGNLAKTVPPAGVNLLSGEQLNQVRQARQFDPATCAYNGPANNTAKNLTLGSVASTLSTPGDHAIEMWLYNEAGGSNQVLISSSAISGTPDKRYMFHSCLNGNLLNVDIYSQEQNAANEIEFVLSNHITVDVTNLQPLRPWVHVVVQSSNLVNGLLQVYVNGSLRMAVNGDPSAGCSWEVNSGSTVQLPENIATLKHIRIYNQLLQAPDIAANAASQCLGTVTTTNLAHWGRFNAPPGGGGVIVDVATGAETQFTPTYPAHKLPTTYQYNSMGQVIVQTTPDAGTSTFWYDRLGRLVASQNAEQLSPTNFPGNGGMPNRYSYTVYDEQSRITEVGEKEGTNIATAPGFFYNNQDYLNFLSSGTNKQVTQTVYDVLPTGNGVTTGLAQTNLRKRVSASFFKSDGTGPVEQGSYYSYDLMGNVKSLWQQIDGLGVKKIDYQYDLASGKVNAVGYQMGQADEFYHQYKYDAENKLLRVLTGTTAIIDSRGNIRLEVLPGTNTDAEYKYYLHGPLARTELGSGKVQGIDYAYTLQGWLKGINGSKLDANTDIGEDGKNTSVYYAQMARDAMAYTLGYYNGDYKPIGGTGANAFNVSFASTATGFGANLYNGNISYTTVALSKINDGALAGYTYKYDQLNRLMGMQFHTIGTNTNWNNTPDANNPYAESYHYDANGNITALTRNGTNSQPAMDNLKYWYYYKDANGVNKYYDADPTVAKPLDADKYTNRLAYVQDAVSTTNYTEDIDGQSAGNYQYDKSGNLISDASENLAINWTVYGKIKSIVKSNDDATEIDYAYDAGGNRVYKRVYKTSNFPPSTDEKKTFYVRDAQGNVLAVYESSTSTANGKPGGSTALAKTEQHLYGSSRLGIWMAPPNANTLPLRKYELTNHLGNVMATIAGEIKMLVPTPIGSPPDEHAEAYVLTMNDYYPFGMIEPGRKYDIGSGYRFGFNGKEMDNETKGTGAQYDYGFRIYDPRLGRFLSVDPLTQSYPWYTPYQFAGNTPIWAVDLDGLEEQKVTFGNLLGINGNATQRVSAEFEIRQKVVDAVYALINKQIISREGDYKFRTVEETSVIKNEISNHVKVDIDNNYATVVNPQTNEPTLFYTFAKKTVDFAVGEMQPVTAKAAGTAAYSVGSIIQRAYTNLDSYKTNFYKKFFPAKYAEAMKINSAGGKAVSKFLKGTGTFLKATGKGLDIAGSVIMFYDVLSAGSPKSLSDDDFRRITREKIQEYFFTQSNSTNTPNTSSSQTNTTSQNTTNNSSTNTEKKNN